MLDAVVETAALVWALTEDRTAGCFISALQHSQKDAVLRGQLGACWTRSLLFLKLPNAVFAYWIPENVLRRYLALPRAEAEWVKKGLSTADNFRFFRLCWETPLDQRRQSRQTLAGWVPIAKGGEYRPYHDDIHLEVKWHHEARELKAFITERYPYLNGDWGWVIVNSESYFKPALTWSYRTTSAFCLKVLPAGCAFSDGGWALCVPDPNFRLGLLAIYNSPFGRYFLEIPLGQGDTSKSGTGARNYSLEPVTSVPLVVPGSEASRKAVLELIQYQRACDKLDETSSFYSGPVWVLDSDCLVGLARRKFERHLKEALRALDDTLLLAGEIEQLSGFAPDELRAIWEQEGRHPCSYDEGDRNVGDVTDLYARPDSALVDAAVDAIGGRRFATKKAYFVDRRIELISHVFRIHPRSVVRALLRDKNFVSENFVIRTAGRLFSHFLGVAIGRWSVVPRGNAEVLTLTVDECFAALPECPAALDLQHTSRGVLVDDFGQDADAPQALLAAASGHHGTLVRDAASVLVGGPEEDQVRAYLRKGFFAFHIATHSKSRRKAPIYWQLATPSANYSVWLYYHRFTKDTFYKVLNDHVTPKFQHENRKLTSLMETAGPNPAASQRKDIVEQEAFVEELRAFQEEIARVAPLWNPNLDDGVIINFAPLWGGSCHRASPGRRS
ncbi:MAG: hypothetical protein ACREYF_09495 [Gammaproteobacteria bacterium]